MSVFLIKTFRVHPEDKDNKGFTPLHAACQSGNVKTGFVLLERHEVQVIS